VGNDIDEYMTMIDRSIERIKGMRTLILDLLDLTKLESSNKIRKIEKVELYDVAKLAFDTVSPLAIQKELSLFLSGDESTSVMSDKSEMEILFNNLVSNAVKYNTDNGKVNLYISKDENNAKVIVEDTGIGMSEEETAKLFQEFVRIKNSKTKNVTGSGLGLSIAKKMVELNRGSIDVESTPDVGSKFIVRIPLN